MITIEGFGSGKTNTLLSLIKQQNYHDYNVMDEIYLYVKDPDEKNHLYLIKNM